MNSIFHSFANEQKPAWRHQQQTEGNEDEVDDENYCYYLKVKLLENPKLLVVIIIHHLGSSILRLLPQLLLQKYNLSIPNQQHILFVPSCTSQMALILNNSGKQKNSLCGKILIEYVFWQFGYFWMIKNVLWKIFFHKSNFDWWSKDMKNIFRILIFLSKGLSFSFFILLHSTFSYFEG